MSEESDPSKRKPQFGTPFTGVSGKANSQEAAPKPQFGTPFTGVSGKIPEESPFPKRAFNIRGEQGIVAEGSGDNWIIRLRDQPQVPGKTVQVAAVEEADYWALATVPDTAPVQFTLELNGAAIQPAGSVGVADSYAITNKDSAFTPVDTHVLYLKAVRNATTGDVDISLEYGAVWTDSPSSYKIVATPRPHMDEYYYPLYETFLLADSPTGKFTTIGEFKLKRLVPNNCLQINNVFWRRSTASDVVAVVEFSPPAEPFVPTPPP